ncbi:hypothetical protein AAF712_015847 [Marasmius tenuissimus]|uniref:Uncharacterized protein n=1 Tax=Marasmius tenuissimus TaxID=585030 RepID=A0ABR2Z9F5_9AGAR
MSGGSNIYGPKYDSPAGVQFNSDSQAGAIAALLGGLTVGGNNASTEPSGTSGASAGLEPRSRSVSVGVIVGGVMGGITLAGLVAASLWTYRRRVRAESGSHETASQWGAPDPFLDMTPRAMGKNPPPPPGTSPISGRTDASSNSGATSTLGFMATAMELVVALNQHLGTARPWDPNEQPPEYSTQIEHGGTSERGKC